MHHVALVPNPSPYHSRFERGHLDRNLIGLEFDDCFARRDGLALLLQPA